MTQRECILLVELLRAENAHALSTNGMRSLCVVIVIVLVISMGCTACVFGAGLFTPHHINTHINACFEYISHSKLHSIDTFQFVFSLSPEETEAEMLNRVRFLDSAHCMQWWWTPYYNNK